MCVCVLYVYMLYVFSLGHVCIRFFCSVCIVCWGREEGTQAME